MNAANIGDILMVLSETLSPSLFISDRLMAAVKVGDGVVHIEYANEQDQRGADHFHYIIESVGEVIAEGTDLSGWDDLAGMMATLLSFLYACAEAYRHQMSTGRCSDNIDLFPPACAEWAYMNSDEINILLIELEEHKDGGGKWSAEQ